MIAFLQKLRHYVKSKIARCTSDLRVSLNVKVQVGEERNIEYMPGSPTGAVTSQVTPRSRVGHVTASIYVPRLRSTGRYLIRISAHLHLSSLFIAATVDSSESSR